MKTANFVRSGKTLAQTKIGIMPLEIMSPEIRRVKIGQVRQVRPKDKPVIDTLLIVKIRDEWDMAKNRAARVKAACLKVRSPERLGDHLWTM